MERRVIKCQICTRNSPPYRHKRKIQLFPAAGPFEFITMDNFGTFPKAIQQNQYILFISDRYSKLTHAIPPSKTTYTHIANLFFNHWIVLYVIPTHLLTDTNVQLTNKHFAALCNLLGVKHLTTTAYRP